MNIKETAIKGIGLFRNNWKTPPEGRYMSIKEITSLSVGGIGVKLIVHCISQMIIATNNTMPNTKLISDPINDFLLAIINPPFLLIIAQQNSSFKF